MSNTIPEDFHSYLTDFITQAVTRYLAQENLTCDPEQLPIDLRFSAQSSFGDYSMPVMAWAGKQRLGRPPLQIAEALSALIRDLHSPLIEDVTATKPGYLNFRLNQPAVAQAIMNRVLDAGADFGQQAHNTTKVIVEHTNINSNKAAHVGHLRNSCIGDTVVRLLRSQGYQVEADNYIDDSGVQVADVVVGFTLLERGILQLADGNTQHEDESFDFFCSRVYVAVGKLYEAKESEVGQQALALRQEVLHAIEHGDSTTTNTSYQTLAATISRKVVPAHLKTMARLNISYDVLTWESAILDAGLWQRTFEVLKNRNLLEKPTTGPAAGCWILPFGEGDVQTTEGDRSSDKILVRSNGTATYTAKDISYQLWKFGLTDEEEFNLQFTFVPWGLQYNGRMLWTMRLPNDSTTPTETGDSHRFGHADRVINVIDVRQSYLQQVVYESLRRLGFSTQADNSVHLAYEVVTLSASTAARLGVDTSDGRDFYAMSGRKGIEIKADELIDAAVDRMIEVRRQDGKDLDLHTAQVLASSAIRYFMVRYNLQQLIALDMDEALRPNGDTGVYLQYAYARANSIQRRLVDSGYVPPTSLTSLPQNLHQSEWELLRHIDSYPRRLSDAAAQLSPPLLASYAYDLASHFSDFYEHTPPILKESHPDIKAFRSVLVQATIQTMQNVLRTLGFDPLDRI